MDEYFYFNTFKTYITAFGNVFNNVKVKHGNGNVVTVPIRYASKEKFVEFLMDQAGLTPPYYEQAVPVIAYEMTEVAYDPTRAINQLKETFYGDDQSGQTKRVLAPSPYNLTFSLSIFTRYGDEMLQIVEQILPYFRPSFNITIKEVPELGILERDVPIILTSIASENVYVGSKDERRHIEWTLTFEMRAWLYPDGNAGYGDGYPIIRRVIIDFGTSRESVTYTGFDFKADPFDSSPATAQIIDANTYSEIFSGDAPCSLNLPFIGTSAQCINGVLTITEAQKVDDINSFNYYPYLTSYDQYIEAEVRFDVASDGRIILAAHVNTDTMGAYLVEVFTDGHAVLKVQNTNNDILVLNDIPAGSIKSTDEVRLEVRAINPTEDLLSLHINNNKVMENSVPTDYLQLSKNVAVLISAHESIPETVVGIKWLRAGAYET